MKKKYLILGFFVLFVFTLSLGHEHFLNLNIQKKITKNTTTVPTTTTEADIISEVLEKKIIPQPRFSTIGWATCKNEKYGYEFKYPNEWRLTSYRSSYKYINEEDELKLISTTSCEDADDITVASKVAQVQPILSPPEGYNGATTTNCISNVRVIAIPKNKIYEWNNDKHLINDNYIIDVGNHYNIKITKVFEIGRKNAFLSEGNPHINCQPINIITIATENALLNVKTENTFDPEFETILSTFKFTEKNPQL